MATMLCVLYPDPVSGYPPTYARRDIPKMKGYPDGETLPNPKQIDFPRGELLGCVSGGLGLRRYREALGHTLIVTPDKDGAGSEFDRELLEADIVISQPFRPAYLTPERIEKAKKLKLAITAGIGSDHVALAAAVSAGITVAEEAFSNSISIAEHAVMMILSLVRDYLPAPKIAVDGSSLSAQTRHAAGTREILECCFEGRLLREEYLIFPGSNLAGTGAISYGCVQ